MQKKFYKKKNWKKSLYFQIVTIEKDYLRWNAKQNRFEWIPKTKMPRFKESTVFEFYYCEMQETKGFSVSVCGDWDFCLEYSLKKQELVCNDEYTK